MKTNTFLLKTLLLIVIVTLSAQSFAQSQSMMLPIPGTYYVTGIDDLDGCKILNFSNSNNSTINNLPKHTFNYFTQTGQPHNETHLKYANPSMDEMYLGQHPMFAQTVVHDKDGNLLFFIVDNNIYNRFGEAFLYDPIDPTAGNLYLHDYIIDANSNVSGPFGIDYTRFGYWDANIEDYDQSVSIDPEIVIFPIHNNCYKFGIVYSIFDNNSNSGSSTVWYRTLEYIDDKTIVLSPSILVNRNIQCTLECNNFSIRNIAISDFRTNFNNYLLFVNLYNHLYVFTIDEDGSINVALSSIVDIPLLAPNSSNILYPSQSSEMEVIKFRDNYFAAIGFCQGASDIGNANVALAKIDYINPSSNTVFQYTLPVSNSQGTDFIERVKGLEFSPDGSKLYITYLGQSQLYFISVSESGFGNLQDLGVTNPLDYQFSEIELGYDGNLYYIFSNDNETGGGISRLNNPNNPNTSTDWHSNIFSNEINRIYFSHDYGINGSKIPVGQRL